MATESIGWFEIPVNDLARAADFYESVLVRTLGDMEGPAGSMKTFVEEELPVGALVKGEHNRPASEGALLYLSTPDIDGALRRVADNGGEVLVPKTSIGPFGHIAQFLDCEGNRMALHSQ